MINTNHDGIENVTPEFLSMIKLPTEQGDKLNYLIVCPIMAYDTDIAHNFPIGIAFVAAALKASGRAVFTLNLNYKRKPLLHMQHAILTKNIDVVMTGGFGVQFWEIKNVLDAAKEIKPTVVTVVGGNIITAEPVVAMEALENADYGVIGEGEITVNALAYALENRDDPAELDGIICHRNGNWSSHENPHIIPNLDILPFPDYEGFECRYYLEKFDYKAVYTGGGYAMILVFNRSCPYKCTFCFHSCGDHFRKMSFDIVFKQIDWILSQYPVEALWMESELAFSNPQFAMEFCRRIKFYNLKWRCSIRADAITKDTLVAMKESGCCHVFLGIESADNTILKSMRKGITINQIEMVMRFGSEIGLFMTGGLIFGDLEETIETFWRSVDWWQTHREFTIIFLKMICAYPGSHIYKIACEKGIIKDRIQFLKDRCPPVNISKMTDDEYYVIPSLLHLLSWKNKLMDAKVEPQGDYAVNVVGRCPHCAKNIHFKRFKFVFNTVACSCPVCRCDIIINPIESCDFDQLNKNAETLLKGTSAAIWAITPYNFFWLLGLPVFKAENVRIVNKNEIILPENGHMAKRLMTKEVFTPDIIRLENIDTVIIPNAPKVLKEIKKQCVAEYPGVKRIVHITELL